jgi:hypothetical protein
VHVQVYTGWKRPGAFKVTQKGKPAAPAPKEKPAEVEAPKPAEPAAATVERNSGGPSVPVRVDVLCPDVPLACAVSGWPSSCVFCTTEQLRIPSPTGRSVCVHCCRSANRYGVGLSSMSISCIFDLRPENCLY